MDPVAKYLIDNYGIKPDVAASMARDMSAGNLSMSNGVSRDSLSSGLRDSAQTGQPLPPNYAATVPHYANAQQNAMNQQAAQGQQTLNSMRPFGPEPQAPANNSAQAVTAYQDYATQRNDSVDRGSGFDPTAVGRFAPQANRQPTVAQPPPSMSPSPGQPQSGRTDYASSVQKYQQFVTQQYGPERGGQIFRQQMLQQQANLQQQLQAVQSALSGGGGGGQLSTAPLAQANGASAAGRMAP